MRNLCCHMKLKYGMESVALWREWEHQERKIADFHNHRCFTLECRISKVRSRLKNTIRTPTSHHIITKAERQLLNEWVRQINHTLYLHGLKRDICTKNEKFNSAQYGRLTGILIIYL